MAVNDSNKLNQKNQELIEFAVTAWDALAEVSEKRTGLVNEDAISRVVIELIAQRKTRNKAAGF